MRAGEVEARGSASSRPRQGASSRRLEKLARRARARRRRARRRGRRAGGRGRSSLPSPERARARRDAARSSRRPAGAAPGPRRPEGSDDDLAEQARLAEARAVAVERALDEREGLPPAARALAEQGETLALSAVDVEPGREASVAAALGHRAAAVLGRGCRPWSRAARARPLGRSRPPGRARRTGSGRARPLAARRSARRAARVSRPGRHRGRLRLRPAAAGVVVRRRDRGGVPARAGGSGAPSAGGGSRARRARGRRGDTLVAARPTRASVPLRAAPRRARAHRPRGGARRAPLTESAESGGAVAASLAAGLGISPRGRRSCGARPQEASRRASLRSRSSSRGSMPSPRTRGAASRRREASRRRGRAKSSRRPLERLERRREALGGVNPFAKEEYDREKEHLSELARRRRPRAEPRRSSTSSAASSRRRSTGASPRRTRRSSRTLPRSRRRCSPAARAGSASPSPKARRGGGHRGRAAPGRQAHQPALAPLRRREGARRAVVPLRALPRAAVPVLPPRRGRGGARRCEHRPLRRAPAPLLRTRAVHRRYAPEANDGGGGRPLRRDDGPGRRVAGRVAPAAARGRRGRRRRVARKVWRP